MTGEAVTFRVEIIFLNTDTVELKLYESSEDNRYRRWIMNLPVARAIAKWWRDKGAHEPTGKKDRTGSVIISRFSSSHAEVKELDISGHPKHIGWSLPIVVVEALAKELSKIE